MKKKEKRKNFNTDEIIKSILEIEKEVFNPIVGQIYCCRFFNLINWDTKPAIKNTHKNEWLNVRKKDIEDRVNGHIKICGTWFKKEDFIEYKNDYSKQEKKVEARYEHTK